VKPPEMAVFSFIDLPDMLTHVIKRRTHHEKNQFYQMSKNIYQLEYKTMSIYL